VVNGWGKMVDSLSSNEGFKGLLGGKGSPCLGKAQCITSPCVLSWRLGSLQTWLPQCFLRCAA